MKRCTCCGKTKPLTDFHAQKSGKDGRISKCKECRRTAQQTLYRESPALRAKLIELAKARYYANLEQTHWAVALYREARRTV